MYPAEFDYVKVSSLEEAISLKQQLSLIHI